MVQSPVGGDARSCAEKDPMEMILSFMLFEIELCRLIGWVGRLGIGSAGLRPVLEFTHDIQFFDHHVDQLLAGFVRA